MMQNDITSIKYDQMSNNQRKGSYVNNYSIYS